MATPTTVGKSDEQQAPVGYPTTLPLWAQCNNIDIRASHEQKHKEPFAHTHTHTHSAPDSRHGCHNAKPPTQMHYPPMHSNNNIPMWENPASITQTIYLPTMCHPNKPTKTHSCTGWEQTTPDAKQRHVDVIPKINDVSNHH